MNDDPYNGRLTGEPRGGAVGFLHRLAATGEALFVLLGMIILARLAFRAAGLVDADEFLFGVDVEPDFRGAAIAESQWHAVRYGMIFLAIFIIGRIRGRRDRASYGLATGGRSLFALMGFGVGAFVIMHVPSISLRLIDNFYNIGPGTPFWALMKEVPWDKDFWIYMAVSSFLIVPLVEEFVARGYMLGRFRESFSPGGALIIMAVIFAAAHTQYHNTDLYSLGSLFALVWGSLIMGYTVYRTGSLIPAIIAHALVNIPTALWVDYGVFGAMALLLFSFRRAYGEHARGLWNILRDTNDWISLILIAGLVSALGITLEATPWAPYAWLAGLLSFFVASLLIKSNWAGD